MAKWLSKSRVLTGVQCPKALHLGVHRPDLVPPTSPDKQTVFNQGNEIGLVARQQFPGGVEVRAHSPVEAVEETKAALANGASTLYEAAFVHDDVLVRVDILKRSDTGDSWDLIEVKSSTSVKDEHLTDVAIQTHVLSGVGLAINSTAVMHLNNKCVWPDAADLFKQSSITDKIAEHVAEVSETVSHLRSMLRNPEPPMVTIGSHCTSPYDCAFIDHCWKDVPSPSVFELPGFSAKAWELFNQGIVRLDDKRIEPFVGTRLHQATAALSGERWIDRDVIREHLAPWVWPLHFLDFETINYALPRINGTRPYQQVPFQFSCHVLDKIGGSVTHAEFLQDGPGDPRQTLVAALIRSVSATGSVVAYNKKFEAGCIADLAVQFPDQAPALQSIIDRLVDPLPIFREAVYDAKFRGRFGLKSVAPAILGPSANYDGLEVGDGGAAQQAFGTMIDPITTITDRQRLRQALLDYCRQDTKVMVDLVIWLFGQARQD